MRWIDGDRLTGRATECCAGPLINDLKFNGLENPPQRKSRRARNFRVLVDVVGSKSKPVTLLKVSLRPCLHVPPYRPSPLPPDRKLCRPVQR